MPTTFKRNSLYIALVILAAIAAYLNTLGNGFVIDDAAQVLDNPWIRDFRHLPEIFSSGVWGYYQIGTNYYRPMMHIIYILGFQLFGLAPWGYHLVNVLFHAGVSAMVFLVTFELFKGLYPNDPVRPCTAALIAGLLFAMHPIHTEAVSWVAGIPDLSFSFFYLLAFYLYMRARSGVKANAYALPLLSVASFFIAVLCKEPAVTLPAALVVYDFAAGRDQVLSTSSLKRYAPYLFVVLVYIAMRLYALGGFAPNAVNKLDAHQAIINIFPLFSGYLFKLILPVNLNAYYVFHPVLSVFEAAVPLLVSAAFCFLLYLAYRRQRTVFFGMMLFVIPLLPVLYIAGVQRNVFAERYLYLSTFGFALLVSLFVTAMLRERYIAGALMLAVFSLNVFYAVSTVKRNAVWKDDYTLWSDTVTKSPDSAVAHDGVGNALYAQGRLDEAAAEFNTAIGLHSTKAHANLGNVYNKEGELDKAISEYTVAVALEPKNPRFHSNLGIAYGKKGMLDAAESEFKKAISLNPYYADAYNNLGTAYKKAGARELAARQFEKAVSLKPENEGYRRNLAAVN